MLICSTRPLSRVSLANAGGCLLIVIGAIQPQSALAGSSSWSRTTSSWNVSAPASQSASTRSTPPAGSSFNATTRSSFDTPAPPNPASQPQSITLPRNSSELVRLRALIAIAEAGPADYDAVQHQARIAPPKRPTQMTISEIYAWIDATPGQHHAIGRYQIIPATLRGLVRNTGISTNTRFTPQTQDMLANVLIAEAGYHRFRRGEITRAAFMDNLSAIWAGLPLSNGRSRYHGLAGNKATISRTAYENAMESIFPTRQAQNAPQTRSAAR